MLLDLVQKARQSGTSLQYKGLLCQSIENIHQLMVIVVGLRSEQGSHRVESLVDAKMYKIQCA